MNPRTDFDDRETPPTESTATRLRRSPFTDPRALVGSLLIHAAFVGVASFLAFRAVNPTVELAVGRVIQGELESTDNRAPGEPGGASGEPDGRAADLSAEAGIPSPKTKDAAADALISEILPTQDRVDIPTETLPGPSTSGLGMLNARGSGDGGPSGSGTSGAGGKGGAGPGTEFFGLKDKARSFAYVIDCSGSMLDRGSLSVAKRELLASLDQISAEARFGVVFYNVQAKVFDDPSGTPGLMAATPSNKARVRSLLSGIRADGGTDHMLALRAAFDLHPEVIFFLTDANLMTRQEAEELVAMAGKTRIQAIEFGQISGAGGSEPLKLLARSTGGTYRYVDVNQFRP